MALEPGCARVLDACPEAGSGRERVVQQAPAVLSCNYAVERRDNAGPWVSSGARLPSPISRSWIEPKPAGQHTTHRGPGTAACRHGACTAAWCSCLVQLRRALDVTQGRCQVPVPPVVRDTGTLRGHQHPSRRKQRLGPCASAAALAPRVNQPCDATPDAAPDAAGSAGTPRPAKPKTNPAISTALSH